VAEAFDLIDVNDHSWSLVEEFEKNPVYKEKASTVCREFWSWRKVRPDGNSFFRGFGFSYFECVLKNEAKWKRFRDLVHGTKDQLLSQGFPESIDDCYDSVTSIDTQHKFIVTSFYFTLIFQFMDVVNRLGGDSKMTIEELVQTFNNQSVKSIFLVTIFLFHYLNFILFVHTDK
jgi:Peptidase C65 Otubain